MKNLYWAVLALHVGCAGDHTECDPLDNAKYFVHYEQLTGGTCGELQDGFAIANCTYAKTTTAANGCSVTRKAFCQGELFEFTLKNDEAGGWDGTLHASITGDDAGTSCASDYHVVFLKK